MRRARLLIALALVGALAAPAGAQDSTAVAVNTKDGFDIFRLAFHITRTTQNVVDSQNAAVAVSSCTDCETVAIAIQVVLIMSDPDVVTPENLALAINLQCTACETLASAYQFILSTGGAVRFTAEGSQAIAEIRRELLELMRHRDELTIHQIQAAVDALMERLAAVLADELVPAGRPPPEGTPPTPSVAPSETATSDPSPSPSDAPASPSSPSESPSPSESSSPSPTGSAS